jgi:hypothetical protein
MALSRSHDALRPEVARLDEAPAPVPATAAPLSRRRNGTVQGADAARALARLSVEKRAARARFVTGLGMAKLAADAAFRPYLAAGEDWVAAHLVELSVQAGGRVGPGPASIVQSAGIQLAASRFLADKGAETGNAALLVRASRIANDSRQNLLAAYELAVREAKARNDATDDDALPGANE